MENKDSLGVWGDSDQQAVGSHCGTLPGESVGFYHLIFFKNLEICERGSDFEMKFLQGKRRTQKITKVRLGEHTVEGKKKRKRAHLERLISRLISDEIQACANYFTSRYSFQRTRGEIARRAGIQYYRG